MLHMAVGSWWIFNGKMHGEEKKGFKTYEIKIYNHKSFKERDYIVGVIRFKEPKMIQSNRFYGHKTLHTGDGIYMLC